MQASQTVRADVQRITLPLHCRLSYSLSANSDKSKCDYLCNTPSHKMIQSQHKLRSFLNMDLEDILLFNSVGV